MKITNEQLAALQELEPRRKKVDAPVGFEALMAEQLNSTAPFGVASETSAETARVQGILAPTLMSQVGLGYAAQPEQPVLAGAGARLEDIFSSFEAYAGELGNDAEANLRTAYSALEKMTQDIAAFKQAYPNLAQSQPGLASVLNELDVLATTETFKFNRGDYL